MWNLHKSYMSAILLAHFGHQHTVIIRLIDYLIEAR